MYYHPKISPTYFLYLLNYFSLNTIENIKCERRMVSKEKTQEVHTQKEFQHLFLLANNKNNFSRSGKNKIILFVFQLLHEMLNL